MIELSPDNSIIEIVSNFKSDDYTQLELDEINNNNIRKLIDCKTSRQSEILKIISVEPFRVKEKDISSKLLLKIDKKSKSDLIKAIDSFFDDSDICHCSIKSGKNLILESYDGFCYNRIKKEIGLTDKEIAKFENAEMDFSTLL